MAEAWDVQGEISLFHPRCSFLPNLEVIEKRSLGPQALLKEPRTSLGNVSQHHTCMRNTAGRMWREVSLTNPSHSSPEIWRKEQESLRVDAGRKLKPHNFPNVPAVGT